MRRRQFIGTAAGVAAVVGAGSTGSQAAASEVAEDSGVPWAGSGCPPLSGAPGFRLVEECAGSSVFWQGVPVEGETREIVEWLGPNGEGFGLGESFRMHEFVVECPYPVGSRAWLAIADRDERGQIVACGEDGTTLFGQKSRRLIFPRIVDGEEGGIVGLDDLLGRARAVYRAAYEHGFDKERPGPGKEWVVVHVAYRCPDGTEHVLVGLPATWDPRLVLGVMVKGQIA